MFLSFLSDCFQFSSLHLCCPFIPPPRPLPSFALLPSSSFTSALLYTPRLSRRLLSCPTVSGSQRHNSHLSSVRMPFVLSFLFPLPLLTLSFILTLYYSSLLLFFFLPTLDSSTCLISSLSSSLSPVVRVCRKLTKYKAVSRGINSLSQQPV